MSLGAFVAAFFFAGHQLSEWMWARVARAPLSVLERICSSALLGIVLWLAATWALALTFHLRAGTLLASAAVAVAAGILVRPGTRTISLASHRIQDRLSRGTTLVFVVLPLAAWMAFLLWRGYVLPPHTPDALTYHLPRAALLAKTGGFQHFQIFDERVNALPANYEMLLADFLLLSGGDTVTEWLSTLLFALFLLQTGALAARWWGPGLHVGATVLLVAGAPVLLLQGAAHKNDLMACYFLLAALAWLGRFCKERELGGGILAILSSCAAAGTKPHGLLFLALAAPVVLWIAWRARRQGLFGARQLAIGVFATAGGFLLLGGAFYLYSAALPGHAPSSSVMASVAPVTTYGDWGNLWQVPVLALLAPFSVGNETVWVPWLDQYWLWERYDVHASNFGAWVSLFALALPFLAWRHRREPDAAGVRERALVTCIATLLALAILPTKFLPHGYVSGFPRYLLFLPAIVIGWTASAVLARIECSRGARSFALLLAIGASAALFVDTAIDVAQTDKFARPADLQWAEMHPGTRWIPSMPRRAASILDCLAGPGDTVDFHAGHDSWIYPAFGAQLRRDVRFIRQAADIRPDVQWVAVDRAYNVIWKHPDFKDISQWDRYLGRGIATREDRQVLEALLDDRRFKLEFYDRPEVQAVFRRLPAPAATAPREQLDPLVFESPDLGACAAKAR